jgi:hypothetical protein
MGMTRPAQDPRAFLTDASFNAVVVGVGCVCLLAFLFAHESFIGSFIDADKLLPADWTRHVFHDGYPWAEFQLPRVPSLFPDLLIFSPVQIVTGSWRAAMFCLAVVLLVGAIGGASVIAHRLASTPVGVSVAVCWIIVVPLLLLEFAYSGWGRHFMILQPVSHGGSFVVSLGLAPVADALRRRFRSWLAALLFILCSLAVLSDKLFIFSFCIPCAIALWVARVESADRRAILALVAVASAVGWAGSALIHRQPDFPLRWGTIFPRIGLFIDEISPSIALGTLLPVVLLAASVVLLRRQAIDESRRDTALFYWTFAMVAILGTIALTATFLYEDRAAYRYLAAPIWWPTIFLAAGAAVVLRRHARVIVAASCTVTVVAAVFLALSGAAPANSLWTWQHPLARCLLAQPGREPLREGLAEYWSARPIEASSEWALQVDPLHFAGDVSYWGNDLASYARSHADRSRPPDYRFIVMQNLDRAAIAARYGSPDHELVCDAGTIWVYAHPLTVPVR